MDAVVPAAGLGTRLLPLTRAVPKELLPLDGRPVVQHVVDELFAAGIERVCLVTRREKAAIEVHFADDPRVVAVRQPAPRGLGDALLCTEDFVGGRPFVVALGDCVYRTPAVVRALLAAGPSAVAVERVGPERLSHYGVVAVEGSRVVAVIEKPAAGEAPSDLAIAGRYLLAPEVFGVLRGCPPDASGELGLSQALARLERIVAVEASERRYDIGNLEAYTEAFLAFARDR